MLGFFFSHDVPARLVTKEKKNDNNRIGPYNTLLTCLTLNGKYITRVYPQDWLLLIM